MSFSVVVGSFGTQKFKQKSCPVNTLLAFNIETIWKCIVPPDSSMQVLL